MCLRVGLLCLRVGLPLITLELLLRRLPLSAVTGLEKVNQDIGSFSPPARGVLGVGEVDLLHGLQVRVTTSEPG